MLRSDDHWLEISDLFGAAALGDGWEQALNHFADACGGAHGQLLGVSDEPAILFNWLPRMAPTALEEFAEIGGARPASNPRARMGLRLPVLEAWHEADCVADAVACRDTAYADFCRRHDIPHGSQTNLARDPSGVISLAVLRTRAQGVPEAEDRRAFESLAPQARSAVKFQRALEGRGAALLAGALEGLGRPAFICDGLGLVQATTPLAETLLRRGLLRLRQGRLSTAEAETTRRLETAIANARRGVLAPGQVRATQLPLRDQVSGMIEILDVIALPKAPYAFGFDPRVLVVARGPGASPSQVEHLLQEAYALTASEAHIAARLGAGESPDAIAIARQVSPTTIRTQLRSIFQKMDVGRQAELAVRVSRLH